MKTLIVISLCLFLNSKSSPANRDTGGEKTSQKICLNSSGTIKDIINERNNVKGQILLHLSLPYINSFHLKPVNEGIKNNTGLMGYSAGLDYCYKSNQYVNLSFLKIQDFFLPIAFVDRGDEYELMSNDYLSLSNNHKINRFSFGYGISFAKNSWEIRNRFWDENSSTRKPVKKSNNAFGLVFSTYFRTATLFYIGINYKPTFLQLNTESTLKYEHSISIDFAWKIPRKK